MASRRPAQPRVQPIPEALDKARELMKDSVVPAYNVTATLAHNELVGKGVGRFARALLFKGTVSPRQRELVILRMGFNCQAVYEFGQHTLFGLDAGLTDEEIYAVTRPLSTYQWSEEDRILLQMTDDLYTDDVVSDATWAELTAHWSTSDVLEFAAAALCYRVVSGLLNTCGVQLDEGVPGWPEKP